jgi:hypothetical protein
MIYLGIDNGLTGALVALSDVSSVAPIRMDIMPVRKKAKGNEVNGELVLAFIESLHCDVRCDLTVILEIPGKHSPGAQALCSMWDSFGVLRAICEVKGIRHHRITPQQWQKVMLPGCEKGNTKPFALSVARRLWPSESWLATPRSSTPHSGLIDAALIAEYARTKQL